MCSKDWTQVSRSVGKCLYPLCHLIIYSPFFFFETILLCWSQTHDCPSGGGCWDYRHAPYQTQPSTMFLRLRLLGLLVWTHSPPPRLWKNTKNRTGSELIRVPAGNRWSTQKDALEKELFKDMWEGLRADIKGWQIATDDYQWAVISVLRPERTKDSSLNPLSHVAVEEDQQRSEEGLHYRNPWTADKGKELGNNSLYLLLYACFTKYLSLANPSQKSNFSNLSWWISEQLYPHGYKAMAKG